MNQKIKHGPFWTTLFAVISLAWIFPIILVLVNSFKKKVFISTDTFKLPTGKMNAGFSNYTDGIAKTSFFSSFLWSLIITLGTVAFILICTSMCAWWIVRVNTWFAKFIYVFFLLDMIVPFQMVMYPLSKLADMFNMNTPWGLWFIYLGFGAGLPVFIFTGVVKSIPQEVEEAAMIDGASTLRTFFTIVVPMMKPTIISVAILETMWVWNDYLLPYLTLDMQRFKTIPITIQYLRGGYGTVDMGAMMACLVLAIIPIMIFYVLCQKYIIGGIAAGAVKG